MVLFSFASPYFLTCRNLTNIVTQNTYFIIVAIGLSFVMIGGGIDLSVGYQMSLVGVVTAMMMVVYHFPVWLAVVLGLLLGTTLGLDQWLDRFQYQGLPFDCNTGNQYRFSGDIVP